MELLATLRRSGGIDALSRHVGLPPATVADAAEALLPALLGGLRDYVQNRAGGQAGLRVMLAMIDGLGDGNLAVEVMSPGPLPPESGRNLLAQFFGSTDAMVDLARDVAVVSGQEAAILERVLPILTMLVCGYISARAGADGEHGEAIHWLCDLLILQDRDEPSAGSGTAG